MSSNLSTGECCCLYGICKQRHFFIFDYLILKWKNVVVCNDWLKLEIQNEPYQRNETPSHRGERVVEEVIRHLSNIRKTNFSHKYRHLKHKPRFVDSYFVVKTCERPAVYEAISLKSILEYAYNSNKTDSIYADIKFKENISYCIDKLINYDDPLKSTIPVINKIKTFLKSRKWSDGWLTEEKDLTELIVLLFELETKK